MSAEAFRLGVEAGSAYIGGMIDQTTLERAFELARSGSCASVNDIRRQLKVERFDQVEAHLSGSAISRQLRALCTEARASDAA